jgi:hypothetical protein
MRGLVTSRDFGDDAASAITFKVVPPRLKLVAKTLGETRAMLLVTPPADLIEAVLPVCVKVCTRDNAASHCWQAEGFRSVGTTRNSMGVACARAAMENAPASETVSAEVQSDLIVLVVIVSSWVFSLLGFR